MPINRYIVFFILTLLIFTPIFTIQEFLNLLKANQIDRSNLNLNIKLIKDFIFLLILLMGIVKLFNQKIQLNFFFFFSCFIISIIFINLILNNLLISASGLRWITPIFLIFIFIDLIDDEFQKKICKIIFFLFILAFLIQVYQFFYLKSYWGVNIYGYNLRNPGFFSQNNTMAFFALFTYFYNYLFYKSKIINVLVPLSLLLTSSGTGLVVLFIVYGLVILRFFKKDLSLILIIIFISIVIFTLIFEYLPNLTGRNDIFKSILNRLIIFINNFDIYKILISTDFGYATNTGNLLALNIGLQDSKLLIADSTFTSIFINLGGLCLASFIYIFYYVRIPTFEYLIFFLICFLFSFTSIIFESFPMNLLFSINIAYFYSKRRNLIIE